MQHPERIRSHHPAPIRGEVVEAPRAHRIPNAGSRRVVVTGGWPMAPVPRAAGLIGFPAVIVLAGWWAGIPLGIALVLAVVLGFLWVVVTG